MMIIARYLSLIGMLATVAWFLWNPEDWSFDWEPVVGFLFSLSGFITSDISIHKALSKNNENKVNTNDTQLFNKLKALLPSNGSIDFLRQHDFLIEFNIENIEPFYEFHRNWDNAEHEFIDNELEKLRTTLYNAIVNFNHLVGKYSSPNSEGYQSVRTDRSKHDPEQEERFQQEANLINQASDKVVETHQSLIRYGRELIEA